MYVISLRPFIPDQAVTWLEMVPWTVAPIAGAWPFATDAGIAIVTSPYAAECMSGAAEILSGVEFFAPGRGTAAALHRHGIETVFTPVDETSEGLLELPGLQRAHVEGQNVLVIGAEGGRGLIQSTLRSRGAQVDERFIYTRAKNKIAPETLGQWRTLREDGDGYLLLSSLNALQALIDGLEEDDQKALRTLRVLASSERVAEAATAQGFAEVILVGTPNPNEMLGKI